MSSSPLVEVVSWSNLPCQVFLKYWHLEHLNAALKIEQEKVVVVQKIVRGFMAKVRVSHMREILETRNRIIISSFFKSISDACDTAAENLALLHAEDMRTRVSFRTVGGPMALNSTWYNLHRT